MLRRCRQRCVFAGLVLLLAVPGAVGCGKTEAKADGGDGSLTIPDAPLGNRRAFDVMAAVSSDGSVQVPPMNRFTLVLDAEARLAIVGGNGRGAIIGVTSDDGRTFHSAGTFSVGGDGSACSGTTQLRYDNFELTLAGDGFTGTATGTAEVSCGDCSFLVPFGATLAGTADTTPPRLLGAGFTPSNPFEPFGVAASEPLPAGATAKLVADDDTTVDLVPTMVDGIEPLVVGFTKPEVVLRAGQGYAVSLDGLVDFAGQMDRSGTPLRLVLFPAGAPVMEDGFESATGSVLGGAMVVKGGALPAISGDTSLYVGNAGAPGLDSTSGRTLTVRMARQTGDTKLRFSYRVIASLAGTSFAGGVRIGTEGASAGTAVYPFGNGQTVTQMITVAGTPAFASPVATGEVALPADAGSEVLVVIGPSSISCGPIRFIGGGLQIDDLRLE